jgi:hypothetical protein
MHSPLKRKNLIGTMKQLLNLLKVLVGLTISLSSCSQTAIPDSMQPQTATFNWNDLAKGFSYCEVGAPKKSILNDSKITIVRVDPNAFEFFLLNASASNDSSKTVVQWADSMDLNLVFNAGMYELTQPLISRGYMKSGQHINNPIVNPSYNSVIAFNPVDAAQPLFNIIDLKCYDWQSVRNTYTCYAQGMRMIDCNGNALGWNKKKQSCSMLIAATDITGMLYIIFSRSPYTHNEMIGFMQEFPFKLRNAIYLEGGPETSLYIRKGNTTIEKIGSYVSQTYPNDDNMHYWKLPNVIGLRLKK